MHFFFVPVNIHIDTLEVHTQECIADIYVKLCVEFSDN